MKSRYEREEGPENRRKTAAGHGVGFSDRDELGETGERLADVIRAEWRRWHVEAYQSRGWFYLSAGNFAGGDA